MSRISRKKEHVDYALKTGQSGQTGLDDIQFVHQCVPESSLSACDLTTSVGGLSLSSPFFINAMTGGTNDTMGINDQLSVAARESGLAMAVGSQMSAIQHPEYRRTYSVVRKNNPDGIIIANLGAEASLQDAWTAIDMVGADALQIHLNVMQELIMPEGDRDFRGALERIADIAENVDIPVIVKEVGFGISRESFLKILETGVAAVDVGGSGGTNFALIENLRRSEEPLDMFRDWGLNTAQSLLEVHSVNSEVSVIASGGIRNGLDAARAIALGADAAGMAGFFLKTVTESGVDGVLDAIRQLHRQFKIVMTALGVENLTQLQKVPLVISGATYHWARLRGIDCRIYATR
ncbi:MAG: type 2 isopentenyl-diphosphate Delta-isomerase [Bacillaceae bacterium]|nr:type 2 isopentenyl-diphosphate Delta-isomerase [Bacillaceae bacterium]